MKRSGFRSACRFVCLVLTTGVLLHLSGCGDDEAAPPSAELAGLTISAGMLSPTFSPDTTFYTIDVASGVASLTVTPTAVEVSATITVDGTTVATGAASAAIPLDHGVNFIFTIVTATDGVTQDLYVIAVTRAEADAELADLTISEGTFSPVFSPSATFYIVDELLPDTITVTPTALDSGATITVNGTTVDSGTPSSAIDLAMGMNIITILVTATDGVTQMGYTFLVFRGGQHTYLKASNTDANDYFGNSVAVDGDTVVVGSPYEDSNATGVDGDQSDDSTSGGGAVYVFKRTGGVWSQQAYLKASNTDAGDRFGLSVAVDGDTIVVGSPHEASNAAGVDGNQADNSVSYSGAVYVFTRTSGIWSQQVYLKASNTDSGDSFGHSVAIDGDTIVAGAYNEASNATGVNGDQTDNGASFSGAAYVFTRTAGVWSQQAYLKASNTDSGDYFGWSVAVASDMVVVGAVSEASNATGVDGNQAENIATFSGAAYVFTRAGDVWSQQAYLKASNTSAGDRFGTSVALDGDTIIVGAPFEYSDSIGVNGEIVGVASSSGAAYVFTRTGGVWSQQAYVKASNTDSYDYFGEAVSLSGDMIVVGAKQEDSNATGVDGDQADNTAVGSGAAYVFTRTGSVWSQQAYLKASSTDSGDYFGWSVATDGDTVVVGAYWEDSNATGVDGDQTDNSANASGAVYVFE